MIDTAKKQHSLTGWNDEAFTAASRIKEGYSKISSALTFIIKYLAQLPHVYDEVLKGKDLIGLAQTGSGKTGAFAIPILQAFLETPQDFFACALSPTRLTTPFDRELAIQIAEQFEALGSGIGVKYVRLALWKPSRKHFSKELVGSVDHVQQSIALGKRPHIVVATPGRLVDHPSNTKGFTLRTLKYLVMFCDYVKKNMIEAASKYSTKIKETGGKKRRREGDDDEEEVPKYLDR
ncbi:hypothetical protein RJ639_017591 [Escallonia herrerae]|uniref:Helicase ATP-binding domain-containing protein n=1 Tax=Escallonia herrerae TaxID=1293975 RepID=A0AA88VE93_9ASTE|nr:hypothetical protein RJ639_017591 [Escallonia herrerae]